MTDAEILQSLVPPGMDINAVDKYGSSILHHAIIFDCNFEHVRVLIEAGADVNFVDKFGDTAWNIARRAGYHDIADWLLQHGAREPDGIEDDIFKAILWNKTEAVHRLAKSGIDLNEVNVFGVTPLAWAITQEASREILLILLEAGTDVNQLSGNSDCENSSSMPLIHAVETGNLTAVKLLLQFGAEVNAIVEPGNVMNAPYRMAIFGAAYGSQIELLKLLISYGADVNVRDCMGFTPLMVTVREWNSYYCGDDDIIPSQDDNLEVIRMLLDAGADINATLPPDFDDDGRRDHFNMPPVGDQCTALQLAVAKKNTKGAMLLRERGAEIYPNSIGWSWPLNTAIREKNLPLVQQILNDNVSSNISDLQDGTTPLHMACGFGNLSVVKLLLECGADVNAQTYLDEPDCWYAGWTPLMYAIGRQVDIDVVTLLLNYGADVNIKNANGETVNDLVPYWTPEIAALLNNSKHIRIA